MSAKKPAKRGARAQSKKGTKVAAEPQSTPVLAEDTSTEVVGSTPEVGSETEGPTVESDTKGAQSEATQNDTGTAASESALTPSNIDAPEADATEMAEMVAQDAAGSDAPAEEPPITAKSKTKKGRHTPSVRDVTEGLAERPSQAELFLVPEVPPSTETLESFGFDEPPPEEVTENHLKGALEALIFASEKPVRPNELAKAASASVKEVKPVLEELQRDYAKRGIQLVEIAGGYVFRTAALFAPFVRDLTKQKPVKLSRAQIETLAILAYRQPITRPEIDEIRGVDSGPVLKLLLERELIRILGKKDEPGRPILYGTTPNFLEFFNLRSLKDLPTLQEFTELNEDSRRIAEDELGEAFMAVKEQSDEAGLRRDTEFAPPMPEREDYAVSTDLEGEALPTDTDRPGPAEDTIAPPPNTDSMGDSFEEDVAQELGSEEDLAFEGEGDGSGPQPPASKDSDEDDDAFEDDDDDDFEDDSEEDLDDDSDEDLDDEDD